ncbi:TPA: PD-(D/E)XK nuclease-like domain-containing protein [Klebsiella michiganensis]|uniref:PD-(D/E)XK nuclease-like domain-containing protein n=5 Tax=Klebsiella michiganensis TaxID=1134687 RepID=A0AB35Q0J5_9ENTR|nr:RecE family exodeoxyribonuclease [Klebsiella michiganensis]DAL53277.1 MAG TPA_asm: Exodeoxyribonuclease 8 [Caudoviricetes sp.]MBG2586661.1 PD-(D/E)XK nuclease-like domain-containing protein [Klebsiella michiganensis]MBG2635651.1 PD-(D/E)XK nuclease-like domain-containing protein [Klebsiella michiganensis]MBG2685682.1 PD-(D/E)XK nuclease-like domain-containing protein [Klebsiella michiganensis]MBL0786337.1 PD-(D/E)XK nuclease-like domain-containing protein [Klebsiella michiganensis]
MEYFYLIKATQKSGKADAIIWRSAKSEARAQLQLDVDLEDAEIETGRGKDYLKPIRTDFPVFNDLPAEGVLDFEWCKRYQLGDDQRTWQVIPGAVASSTTVVEDEIVNDDSDENDSDASDDTVSGDENSLYNLAEMPFRIQLLAQYMAEERHVYHISIPHRGRLSALEMDTDNSAVQDLILAAESIPEIKKYDMPALWKFTSANKKVFPEGKRHELGKRIQFAKLWFETNAIDRGILTREWSAGNQISAVPHAAPHAIPERYKRAVTQNIANLAIEIAIAQLYPDAEPGKISRPQLIGAKELVDRKEDVHVKAVKILSKTTDILDYDANSIFGVTRAIKWNGEESTSELRAMVRNWLAANGMYENGERSKGYPEWEEDPRAGRHSSSTDLTREDVDRKLAADRGEYVEGISDPSDSKWVHEDLIKKRQPEVARISTTVFSIEGLMASPAPKSDNEEATSDVQMEEAQQVKDEADNPVPAGESANADAEKTDAVNARKILTERCPDLAAAILQDQEPTITPEDSAEEPDQELTATVWPEYFEPGRYEGVPNEVYHAANGISSTMVKDARVSLMYFEARHVSKTINKERSPVLDMGNLVHALALQPEDMDKEFSVEPEIPEGAFTTTATIRAFIDEHNASLPPLLSADDIKALLDAHNATLPAPFPLGASVDESYASYEQLPEEFQRIENGTKHTATAMKACIKEYNATLPAPVKTSGSRDALLEQLAIINPDLVAQEAQKPQPLKVSGTKTDLIQVVKSVKPDAVFADELLDAWRENPAAKVLVTRQQLATALAIQKALLNHPTAGKLLTHPSRAVEVSYFSIDEETGLEVRVRPDIEIDMGGLRIGADLKTISMWNIKQEGLRAKLHREIIERDYHLSAAMYCETAALDQFFWIFVNKDENYHWIAIIEASEELLELGMLEYRKAMRAIANGFDTGEWPAPITEDYAEELNDFDLRRLEALRVQA